MTQFPPEFAEETPKVSPLERFAAAAVARRTLWRVLAGLCVVILMLVLTGMALGAAQLWIYDAIDLDIASGFDDPTAALVLLATFLLWRPALWIALRLFHKRSLASLNGPGSGGFVLGLASAALFAAITGIGALALVGAPHATGVEFWTWVMFALIAAPLIYIQSSAEELLFRGYLLQQMHARFTGFWAWALVPSMLFGLLHWNPAGYGAAAAAVLAITGFTGLAFALFTAATGRLGMAKGMHFGFNFVALLLIAPNEAFSALSLAYWPYDRSSLNHLILLDLVASAALAAAAYAAYRRLR